ncbi:hypothetical protein PHYBLDRAFT_173903 [Phycomyces blakesleeanus NRRL 1555(-)]|uniref:Uncharacterized protein n=1 Tax=Phycomyces blakesleeanus (strain ATCC 8743b / DSM 1359 / FGSC 10004 / NBRC 33097 / NRRL 1555) TaxID=763407 RepID=A0A162TEM7_PHYB8|nr:hypothetical protein PHYBLDRAFT_173903 [Phycomyces blakesleeanus NRRL 1555(-)]OAD67992.1 hypothetical protein PHYBLDRAFT_173903 [Phycomyces blakesleeanus NRRL 1555(-)]|eukprot:XP_018286032.1 hypothetical protein PHYBLDRAFT_173903 [Phycomyces blakesleeanus NRRL 1555(-)]
MLITGYMNNTFHWFLKEIDLLFQDAEINKYTMFLLLKDQVNIILPLTILERSAHFVEKILIAYEIYDTTLPVVFQMIATMLSQYEYVLICDKPNIQVSRSPHKDLELDLFFS